MIERSPDQGTTQAIGAGFDALRLLPLAAVGPVLQVTFPAANTRRDIPHGLGVVPDGYLVVLQNGGVIIATDVHLWTTEAAWLQASAANTIARVVFFALQEGDIRNVVPS